MLTVGKLSGKIFRLHAEKATGYDVLGLPAVGIADGAPVIDAAPEKRSR